MYVLIMSLLLCLFPFVLSIFYVVICIYNCRPPTGQVPIEERCVIEREYLNSYAEEK